MNALPPLPTIGVVPAVAVTPQGDPYLHGIMNRDLPPLPAIPGRLTDWFPMRQAPWQKGEYEVRHDPKRGCATEAITREYWDGFNWPGLRGKFTANAWRGLAQPE